MKIRNQKAAPSLETLEAFLDDIVKYYTPFEKLYRKLKSRIRRRAANISSDYSIDITSRIDY